MIFGLGISRHHATALTWGGSYPGWLLYATFGSVAFLAQGAVMMAREAVGRGCGVTPGMAFGSFLGWSAGAWEMLRMSATTRRSLMGGAIRRSEAR
jgi:hypothetical protein